MPKLQEPMMKDFLFPLPFAILVGVLNWMYWRKQGYTSFSTLFMSCCVAYVFLFKIFEKFA
jgi:hypothetical protein